jgi:hypothetical protein
MTTKFHEKLKRAEVVALDNLLEAINLIESAKDEANFYPWGALTLAKFYLRYDNFSAAIIYNDKIYEKFPDFVPGWSQRIQVYRGSEDFQSVMRSIFNRIRSKEEISESWFVNDYLELILFNCPDDFEYFISFGLANKILNTQLASGLKVLYPFTCGVAQYLRDELSNSSYKAWTFSFLGEGQFCKITDDILHINISNLSMYGIFGWEKTLCKPFILAVATLIGPCNYYLDGGIDSLPHVSESDVYSVIFWRLLTAEVGIIFRERVVVRKNKPADISVGSLWVRVGIVELWALWNYLNNPEDAGLNSLISSKILNDSSEVGKKPRVDTAWWPNISVVNNIVRLCLNAGWYSKSTFESRAFSDWARRYADAMCDANIFDTCSHDILRIAALEPGARKETFVLRDQALLPLFYDANIVFVTAFAEQIQQHYDAGKIDLLWSDLELSGKIKNLKTVSAPMSIWPYQPDEDWSSTFSKLVFDASNAIEESKATVFLASCGAYGLPLVHEIHKRFGITSVYIGHRMNIYFGIITNAFLNDSFYLKNVNSNYWITPDLSQKYSELSRIDDGRYTLGVAGER